MNVGAFAPTRVANLAIWMDASDASTILLNGTNVAEWRSKVNAQTAVQTTASRQPAYSTAAQNGLNVISGDGTDRRLTFNGGNTSSFWSFLHDGTTQWTMYWVGSATSGTCSTYFSNSRQAAGTADGNGLTVNHDFGIVYGNPTIRARVTSTSGVVAQVEANLNSGTVGAMELVGDLTNATAGNRLRLRINNGSQSTSTTGTNTLSTAAPQGTTTIGGSGVGSLNSLSGRVCEIIIYKGAVSDSESTAIRNYLMGKWGI